MSIAYSCWAKPIPTLRVELDRQRVAVAPLPLRGHLTGADPADDVRLKALCALAGIGQQTGSNRRR